MFPFIDTGDPAAELSAANARKRRHRLGVVLAIRKEAPLAGPAALQRGDVAFKSVYGLITGEVRHGVLNQPVAGASVSASE